MKAIKTFIFLSFLLVFPSIASTQITNSGLPLPRFVSLRQNQANLRSGPNERYPIEWVYFKKGLPLEIIAEFDVWRKVRDWEGTEGWIQKTLLSSKRTIRVNGIERKLFSKAEEKSKLVARIESGVIGRVMKCPSDLEFCKVDIQGFQGWLRRSDFWGVYTGENIE